MTHYGWADHTGEPVYIAIEPSRHVIGGPYSPKSLAMSIILASVLSSLSYVPVALLRGIWIFIYAALATLPVYFVICATSLSDYPNIPIITIDPRAVDLRSWSWIRLLRRCLRVGQKSFLGSDPRTTIIGVTAYLDTRPRKQTAFLFVASEKAWSKYGNFVHRFIEGLERKFPSVRTGYLGTSHEFDGLPKDVCKVPFNRYTAVNDLLWYLADASVESNENGTVLHELFSSGYCILHFAPRPFKGLRWKNQQFQFRPFTPETAIRWVDALIDRYCLTDAKFVCAKSSVIFRLPTGDSIPLVSAIVEEVRRRLQVKPRMYEVSKPLSGVRRGTPQIVLCAATDRLMEGGDQEC